MDIYESPEFTALVEISRLANSLQNVMDMGMDDITSRQWLPLMILGRCGKAPNLNHLAEKCGITRQSAKQLVDRLAEKGLVKIEKAANDKWGADNLDRNLMFVHKLFENISPKDLSTFCSVQQILLVRLSDMKEQLIAEAINE